MKVVPNIELVMVCFTKREEVLKMYEVHNKHTSEWDNDWTDDQKVYHDEICMKLYDQYKDLLDELEEALHNAFGCEQAYTIELYEGI